MTSAPYQCFFHYFGLREDPFHVSPDPRFYHSTPTHDAAHRELLYGLETRQGLMVLSGEAGTGKTTILNSILDSLRQRGISTAYIFHPLLRRAELFEFILYDFGVSANSHAKGELVRTLQEWLIARNAVGDCPVVILDEAQSLSLKTLDQLRLLLNLETPGGKLLQIILAGQTELEEKLCRPELRQLRQRVMFHSKLTTLSVEQTAAYIQTRLAMAGGSNAELFPQEAIACIHQHAKGIPRVINLLCEHALITAYGEQQPVVSGEMIERIAADFDLAATPISTTKSEASTAGRALITAFSLFDRGSLAISVAAPEAPAESSAAEPARAAAIVEASIEPSIEPRIEPSASPVVGPLAIVISVEPVEVAAAVEPSGEAILESGSVAKLVSSPAAASELVIAPNIEAAAIAPPSSQPPIVVAPLESIEAAITVEPSVEAIAETSLVSSPISGIDAINQPPIVAAMAGTVIAPPLLEAAPPAVPDAGQVIGAPDRAFAVAPPVVETARASCVPRAKVETNSPTVQRSFRAYGKTALLPKAPDRRGPWKQNLSVARLSDLARRAGVSFAAFWRDAAYSFVRDCRYFVHPQRHSQQPRRFVARPKQISQQQSLLGPIMNWLRHPVTYGRLPAAGHPSRHTSTK